jgi:hypothetical protein
MTKEEYIEEGLAEMERDYIDDIEDEKKVLARARRNIPRFRDVEDGGPRNF